MNGDSNPSVDAGRLRRPERFGTIAALSGVLDFRRFVDEARAGMLPEIEPGEHAWPYWDRAIQTALRFFLGLETDGEFY